MCKAKKLFFMKKTLTENFYEKNKNDEDQRKKKKVSTPIGAVGLELGAGAKKILVKKLELELDPVVLKVLI